MVANGTQVPKAAEETRVKKKEEAVKKIGELVTAAQALIGQATALADEWDIEFSFNVNEQLATSTYVPGNDWNDSSCWGEEASPGKWKSSSELC